MQRKYIVTTTINEPTKASILFSKKKNWTFVVVGDKKTPHDLYKELDCVYLSPKDQEELNKPLSDCIGWNSIQRRNMGFVYAWRNGADIVATVDDDNVPYDFWGEDLLINRDVEVDIYEPKCSDYFDPLVPTNYNHLWHRGFPIEELDNRKTLYMGKKIIRPKIQADLWDGDPDIDAICRLTYKPICKFNVTKPYASSAISPFNSQNTFLAREVLPNYFVHPDIGRMDDIWPSYDVQRKLNKYSLVYNKASVYQERNPQDLIKNLEDEMIGYRNTFKKFMNENYCMNSNFIQLYKKALNQ